nr:TspO/MBR family protein [Rhodoferax sp.]
MPSMPQNDNRRMASPLVGFVGWLAICFVAAAIGGLASANAGDFYNQLTRPNWAPPAWLFAPVWTMLYVMMAVAAWIVWRDKGWHKGRTALSLFLVQLAANALWTWIFFVWHLGAAAFAEIALLWLLIAATVVVFWRIHKLAGALLLPYLAWVSFATALSYAMWQRNPQIL